MYNEIQMKYFVELPNDGSHDHGLKLEFNEQESEVYNIVVSPEDKRFFQRIKIFNKGFIIIEEVWSDKRVLRFNRPFEQIGDVLKFDF